MDGGSAAGEAATVRPAGPLRVDNGDAPPPSLIAGIGFGALPEFLVRQKLGDGSLCIVLPDWRLLAAALHW